MRGQQTESCVNGRSQWVQLNKSTFPSLHCRRAARQHCPPPTDMQQESLLQKDRPDGLASCVPVLFSQLALVAYLGVTAVSAASLASPRRRVAPEHAAAGRSLGPYGDRGAGVPALNRLASALLVTGNKTIRFLFWGPSYYVQPNLNLTSYTGKILDKASGF